MISKSVLKVSKKGKLTPPSMPQLKVIPKPIPLFSVENYSRVVSVRIFNKTCKAALDEMLTTY